jgi:hypothetical protein
MTKPLQILAAVGVAAALFAPAALATDVYSAPADVYSAPADVYVAPHDVYVAPKDVYVAPNDVYVAPRAAKHRSRMLHRGY